MSDEERTGKRDLTYSQWHRRSSLSEHIGKVRAECLHMIDVDCCEYCFACGEPIALVETQKSESNPKPARVTSTLAKMAGIECYSVSYRVDSNDKITSFARKQLVPVETKPVEETPEQYARWLWMLRVAHEQECKAPAPWQSIRRRTVHAQARGAS